MIGCQLELADLGGKVNEISVHDVDELITHLPYETASGYAAKCKAHLKIVRDLCRS